ncbi:MAG: gamma-glutamyltransferase family protein, partial [Chloroflexi bacterium]|nr:gamma-glutamyltransferase family protein [Chloroflexota bacterium]
GAVDLPGGRGGDTAHIDVVDRLGNVVAATPSGGWLQSSPAIPGFGFALGTRAQTMWLEPGLPNTLAPRKRPRTTLSPSIAHCADGRLFAFGSPGGDAQDQWGLQFFLGHSEKGLSMQDAADAPSFQSHHAPQSFWPRDGRPGLLEAEASHDPAVLEDLRQRGHTVRIAPAQSQGWPCAVRAGGTDAFLTAAATRRGGHCSAVVR